MRCWAFSGDGTDFVTVAAEVEMNLPWKGNLRPRCDKKLLLSKANFVSRRKNISEQQKCHFLSVQIYVSI